MQIADDDLQRYEHRKQPDSHLLHDEALLDMTFAAQMVRGYADHDERGRDEERDRGVHQAVWEGRIEDDPIPVVRHEAAVDDRMADRSLHPTVRGQDPERGQERAQGDHHNDRDSAARCSRRASRFAANVSCDCSTGSSTGRTPP